MSIASSIIGILRGVFGSAPGTGIAGGMVIYSKGAVTNNSLLEGRTPDNVTRWSISDGGNFTIQSVNSSAGYSFGWNTSGHICISSAGSMGFSATTVTTGTGDTEFTRLAAGVFGSPWVQQTSGRGCTTADATNATAALANVDGTNWSKTLIAGRKYAGFIQFFASNTVGAEGLQFDFNGGTATFTDFRAGFSGSPVGATLGVSSSNSNATALTATTVSTSDVLYEIGFNFVCNAGGTFIPRFAEVTHTTGTATIRKSAALIIEDMP